MVSNMENRKRWVPVSGKETELLLSSAVSEDSRENVRLGAVSVLAKGISPNSGSGRETGLVIGYVQSGKTTSFETVIALARDNKFRIIIVIAGTSNPLFEQSTKRLERDLQINDPKLPRRWKYLLNPSLNTEGVLPAIRNVLEEWDDSSIPSDEKRTILIAVLKNHQRLQQLSELVNKLDLHQVPVLVVDDEADQAGLNNKINKQQESTTYRCLMTLREKLHLHSYIQYTATPQAPLLISLIDSLSPNFVQVLDPGTAYVGGKDFFGEDQRYIRIIPNDEIAIATNSFDSPPDSLISALRIYLLGVASGIGSNDGIHNRSMLIHPSHLTILHEQYAHWIRNILSHYKRILHLDLDEPDRHDLIDEFCVSYKDLKQSSPDRLPPFEKLQQKLMSAIRNTQVIEINARGNGTPSVDWHSSYGWILVGGQAIDRGFTVEGLTVTYMPRGVGIANADTIQQRARFFGYKMPYMGYCRVYLSQDTLRAYKSYVEHEENIRSQLINFQSYNQPLNDWKRAFVLDSNLRPCRKQVLDLDYSRVDFSGKWIYPTQILTSNDVLEANQQAISIFCHNINFYQDQGHPDRTKNQIHHVCKNITLKRVIEKLLVPMRIARKSDSLQNTALLLLLSDIIQTNPSENCAVYIMSPDTKRTREVYPDGSISELFQGRGENYRGDRNIYDCENVTVQIHILDLAQECGTVIERVPTIAVRIPERLGQNMVVQDPETNL